MLHISFVKRLTWISTLKDTVKHKERGIQGKVKRSTVNRKLGIIYMIMISSDILVRYKF